VYDTGSKVLHEALDKVLSTLDLAASGVSPENVTAVVQYLSENGFVLVPKTIIGIAGWTPEEERAFRAGVMWERFDNVAKPAIPVPES
jgi:hypothetical protein